MKRVVFVLVLMLAALGLTQGALAVPYEVTYQGKLTDSSGQVVPDSTYQVQFKLYTVATGGTAFWTSTVQSVTTSGGVFTTQLQPLTVADLANKTDVWLETWAGSPLIALSPRVKLTSAPFALRADDLTLPFAGTTSASGVAFSVTSTGTAKAGRFEKTSGSVPALEAVFASGNGDSVEAANLGTGRAGYFSVQNSGSAADALAATTKGTGNAFHAFTTATGRPGLFEITNSANASDALAVSTSGNGNAIYAWTSGTGTAIKGYVAVAGAIAGTFNIVNASNSNPALVGSTTGGGDAVRGYTTGTGRAGYFRVNNAASSASALFSETNGTGRGAEFQITNAASTADAARATTVGSGDAVEGYATGTGSAGHFQIANASSPAAAVFAETNGTGVVLHASNTLSGTWAKLGMPYYGVQGRADLIGGRGVYGYSTGQAASGVYGEASNYEAYGVYGKASNYAKYGVYGETSSATGAGVYALNGADSGVGLYARGGATGWAAAFSGNVRILDRATENPVIELGKGLDYAEGFDVSGDSEVQPGTVLVIDPQNPGKLAVSARPYDRRVAGIVAGARGIGSGVRLGADGFDRDVALAGRVYCNVDASSDAVEPGDLLTTSSTPGYAMKVRDYTKAQGAILGKAMERLGRGAKGQIMVLVTLQ